MGHRYRSESPAEVQTLLNVRSKTVKANVSCVVNSASHFAGRILGACLRSASEFLLCASAVRDMFVTCRYSKRSISEAGYQALIDASDWQVSALLQTIT